MEIEKRDKYGFIIVRHVNSEKTNDIIKIIGFQFNNNDYFTVLLNLCF
jgi:hypothetical protein